MYIWHLVTCMMKTHKTPGDLGTVRRGRNKFRHVKLTQNYLSFEYLVSTKLFDLEWIHLQ
jgi:hypothetical protein